LASAWERERVGIGVCNRHGAAWMPASCPTCQPISITPIPTSTPLFSSKTIPITTQPLPLLNRYHYSLNHYPTTTQPPPPPTCPPLLPNTSTSPTSWAARCSASPLRTSRSTTLSRTHPSLPRLHPPPRPLHHHRSHAPSRAPPASPVSSRPSRLMALRGSATCKMQ
jgi:hypothetical protein